MKTIFIDVETVETQVTTNLTAAKQTRIYGPEFFLFVPDHLVQEESKLSLKKWSKVPHLSVATDPHLLGWNVLARAANNPSVLTITEKTPTGAKGCAGWLAKILKDNCVGVPTSCLLPCLV